MKSYEFLNNDEAPSAENAEGKTVECTYSDFTDGLICTSKKLNKLKKRGKKMKKTLSKNKKMVKAIRKEMGHKVEALGDEINELKRDVAKFKKSARDNLFRELVHCDDATERRRLIAEVKSLEVFE